MSMLSMFNFRRRKKFSMENLRYLCSVLEKNPTVSNKNKQLVIETLRQIAELMIWGDQNNDNFFFFLAEKSLLRHFLNIVRQKFDRSVTVQVMQTLSIMIQNISKQTSLYYLFSNNYINDLIIHEFDFTDAEILAYYVSFLKTISLKLDRDVINFFFNAKAHDFPLYSEALKFATHRDQMVRIAVRTLTLNVFRVNDPDLRRFITDRSAVPYFSNMVWFIKDQCILLNDVLFKTVTETSDESPTILPINAPNPNPSPNEKKEDSGGTIQPMNSQLPPHSQLQQGVEEQVDHYYYLEDIFLLGIRPLTEALIDQFLSHFILPVLYGSLINVQSSSNLNKGAPVAPDDQQSAKAQRTMMERRTRVSKQLALFLLTQVMNVFSNGGFVNALIVVLMHPHPPRLANKIVDTPPQNAVKTSVPVVYVLCHRQSYYRRNSISQSAEDNISEAEREDSLNGRSEVLKESLRNDLNLKPRSRLDSCTEVSDPVDSESMLLDETNRYRTALMDTLNSDPSLTINEQLIASTAALILTLLRNPSTSEDLLIEAGICPQKRRRKRTFFNKTQKKSKNPSKGDTNRSFATDNPKHPTTEQLPEERTTHPRLYDLDTTSMDDLIASNKIKAAQVTPTTDEKSQHIDDDSSDITANSTPVKNIVITTQPSHISTNSAPMYDDTSSVLHSEDDEEDYAPMTPKSPTNKPTKSEADALDLQSRDATWRSRTRGNPNKSPLPTPSLPSPMRTRSHSGKHLTLERSHSAHASKESKPAPTLVSSLPSPLSAVRSAARRRIASDAGASHRNGNNHSVNGKITSYEAPETLQVNSRRESVHQRRARSNSDPDYSASPQPQPQPQTQSQSESGSQIQSHASSDKTDTLTSTAVVNGIATPPTLEPLSTTPIVVQSSDDRDSVFMSNNSPNSTAIDSITLVKDKISYPVDIVYSLLTVLQQIERLSVFTIRVLIELIIELTQDRTMKNNGLNDEHYSILDDIWAGVKSNLRQYLPMPTLAMETFFIDSFEEEWRAVRHQPKIESLIANPIRILPPHLFSTSNPTSPQRKSSQRNATTTTAPPSAKAVAAAAKYTTNPQKSNPPQKEGVKPDNGSEQPSTKRCSDAEESNSNSEGTETSLHKLLSKDPQQLLRRLERVRKSIQNFLHMSRLKNELLGGLVQCPFVARSDWKYYSRLQVPLSRIAPGCMNCLVLMANKKRRRVLFSIREPDWLLLFNRMKGRAGFAMCYVAIPVHSIEGVVNKADPRVVHLAIRSHIRPHECCLPLPNQKHKWSLTLFFDAMFTDNDKKGGHTDALTALDYIERNRVRLRRKLLTHLTQLCQSHNDADNDDDANNEFQSQSAALDNNSDDITNQSTVKPLESNEN